MRRPASWPKTSSGFWKSGRCSRCRTRSAIARASSSPAIASPPPAPPRLRWPSSAGLPRPSGRGASPSGSVAAPSVNSTPCAVSRNRCSASCTTPFRSCRAPRPPGRSCSAAVPSTWTPCRLRRRMTSDCAESSLAATSGSPPSRARRACRTWAIASRCARASGRRSPCSNRLPGPAREISRTG